MGVGVTALGWASGVTVAAVAVAVGGWAVGGVAVVGVAVGGSGGGRRSRSVASRVAVGGRPWASAVGGRRRVGVGVGVGSSGSHGVDGPSVIRDTGPFRLTTSRRPHASSPKDDRPETLMPIAASVVGASRSTERSAALQKSPYTYRPSSVGRPGSRTT